MSIHVIRIFYNISSQRKQKYISIVLLSEKGFLIIMRIREMREDKDITQKQMAKLLNCTQQTYSRYETGEILIDIHQLVKLANFYNTSLDYIVGLTDEMKPYPKTKKLK